DVGEFVAKLRRQLTKRQVAVADSEGLPPKGGVPKSLRHQAPEDRHIQDMEYRGPPVPDLRAEVESLRQQLSQERSGRADLLRRLESVRNLMRPQYESLRNLFEELGSPKANGLDKAPYQPWLAKA